MLIRFFLIFWYLVPVIYSQNKKVFFLYIKDGTTDHFIPFVRIHYMSARSVLTDDKGKTIIFFPKETSSDSVMIVAGGYEPTWYLYDGKKIRDTVFLYPKKETLEEVEVTGSQLKKKIVTNSPFSCSSCGGFISTDGKRKGSEVAAKIKLSANKTFFITGLIFNVG